MANSVTRWIHGVKSGDATAMAPLWDRYSPSLQGIARRFFSGGRSRVVDADDVVADTFQRLWDAAQRNQLETLTDRDALARLLTKIASQRAIDLLRSERRQSRGGGEVRGDSVFGPSRVDGGVGFAAVPDKSLPPDAAMMALEGTRSLLDSLEDEELESIAVAKMEGHTNHEVSELIGCSLSTVERSLRLIRKRWQRVLADDPIE